MAASIKNHVTLSVVLQANHHEKELSAIKERLDQLDEFQRAQFKELKGASPQSTPLKQHHKPPHSHSQREPASESWRSKQYDSGSDGGQEMLSDDGLDTFPVKCS